ncbi:hypothetical protein ACP70R_000113 [Stipagrostis hirtigluma subsp. patula]
MVAFRIVGYVPLLRAMMWRANFSSEPRFSIYARGYGYGMDEYKAVVDLAPRLTLGGVSLQFVGYGTSAEMAVQMAAYNAIGRLRHDFPELAGGPFEYFPARAFDELESHVAIAPPTASYRDRHMSELIREQDRTIRCLTYELYETRHDLRRLQCEVEPSTRIRRISPDILYGGPSNTVHERAPLVFRFPSVESMRVPRRIHMNAMMGAGLRVRRFPIYHDTADTLLGSDRLWLEHPDAPNNTGFPSHYGMDQFPLDFVRTPYRDE